MESVVKRTVKYLCGYQHVADFQKLCGIKILSVEALTGSNGIQNGAAGTNGSVCEKGKSLKNGTNHTDSDPVVSQRTNGHTVDDTTHSETNGKTSNGFAKNGEKHKNGMNGYAYHKTGHEKLVYKIENWFLYYLLQFGANLGSEMFYLTFFPFMFWNVSCVLTRNIVLVWHVLMYFGQILKDYFKWSRPLAPAVRLEKRFDMEYGMPSTHAIVGSCVPFTVLYVTSRTYEFPYLLGLIVALAWTSLVACSRVYLGMHTVVDVLAGLSLTAGALPLLLPLLDQLDAYQVTNPYAPIVTVLLPFLLCIFYPKQKEWSITRGDTANIMSIGAGISLGCWLNHQLGYNMTPYPTSSVLLSLTLPSYAWLWQSLLRFAIGVVSLSLLRIVMKQVALRTLLYLTGVKREDIATQRKMGLEVPVRFISIGFIAFATSFLLPLVFSYFNICREALYREM